MTETLVNTDAPNLLKKSQVIQQISRGPTIEEVAAQLLRQALKAIYPDRDIDPDRAMIGTPQWRLVDDSLAPMPTRFESLTKTLIRQFFTSSRANYLEGEHFLTMDPLTHPVVHLDISIEAIATLLNDHAPLLYVAFGEFQLEYWNHKGRHAVHWLELSAALRKTLDVQQVKGWDHVQCQVARAVARDPDKKERQRHDPALSAISACLIDVDTVDAQGITRHQLLAGAAVLKGRYQDRDLLMMYTVEDGYKTFDSLAQLGASLPERIKTLAPGQKLVWQLYEPEGNFFDHMAWALVTSQLDAIRAITQEGPAGKSDSPPGSADLIEKAGLEEKNTLVSLDSAIPDWLFDASATDLDHYSQAIDALGKLHKHSDKKLLRISPIDTYAQQRMREAIIAEQPSAAKLALDNLRITITNSFESGGLTLPNPLDVHTETLGEYALQNNAPYQATLRFEPPQPVPAWLDAAYLTTIASQVDIGEAYPRLIRDKLLDDPEQAPLQRDFYINQIRTLLPLIALECKIRRIGGIDELGYRYIREWLNPPPAHSHPVLIRPLTFVRSGTTEGDTVANMFIIAPQHPAGGPCLLYRPLFEQPLLQFPSTQNLLYALHQPGELRDSVLAWLPDSNITFKYAQYTFPVGLPSPWLSTQLLSEPWTSVSWAGPVELSAKALTGDVFPTLFNTHALAMAELADRQSLSNTQRRWAMLQDSGWALFNVAANFLGGTAGAAIWIWQSLAQLEQVQRAWQRGDTHAQWSAIGDMLLNLGMILAHHAASRRKTGPRTTRQLDQEAWLKSTDIVVTQPAATPDVTLRADMLTGELPSNHLSSLEPNGSVPHRSPTALAHYLDSLAVRTLDITKPEVQTLLRDKASLYQLDSRVYAQVGERWFQVQENEDQHVQIVYPHSPSKTGPLLIHNQQGQWFVDTRLRLRGGAGGTSLRNALRAQRQAKEQERNQLGATLETFKRQEPANNAALKKAQSDMEATTGAEHEQATARYLGQVEKLIGEYDQALQTLVQWRLKGGTEGYLNDMQRLSIELQKNLALWFALKRTRYTKLTQMLADDAELDSTSLFQTYVEGVRQTMALSHELIARLELSQKSLAVLEATGSAGMTTAQSLRKLLPAFNQWDLKSNEIGMSHEICLRGTATVNVEPAREAVGSLILEAATAAHHHSAMLRSPLDAESSAQRIEHLTRLIDVYADANQRLTDLPGEYPDKIEATEVARVGALIDEFKQLAQEQLDTLLPDGERIEPPTPQPPSAGPSRPVGKVTKTRPRNAPPAKTSPAAELPLAEFLPAKPKANAPPLVDDIDILDDALALNEGVQDFIERTRKDAFRPNRIPADMQDVFDQQAQRLEQAAVNVEPALERLRASGKTRPPVGNLSQQLNNAALQLRKQGVSVRAALLKSRQPRQAYVQWLLDNNQVRIVRNEQGRIKTKKRQDYFQEYRILDSSHNDQVLWLAHFHYDSLAAPAHQFSVAHLKIADPQLQQLSKEQRLALTTLAPIDYVLRRISDPSLFLKLEQQS